MKKARILFLLFPFLFNAQILDKYPYKQDFYQGGISKLYSDIHQIILDKKIEKCANPKEIYQLKLLLTKEGAIKLVKDFDTANIAANQCAYDLSKTLAINLKDKKWNPAVVKNQKFSSIVELIIFPADLFDKFRRGYKPYQFYTPAKFKDGEKKGEEEFHNTFQSLFIDYDLTGRFYLDFYIDKDGEIVSPSLQPAVTNLTFNKEVFRTLKRLNHKWIPATFQGVPIKSKISIPLGFSTTYYEK